MMKKIVYIIGVTLAFSSCSFLDTEVYGNLDEKNLYHDENSCMAGLAGIYDRLGAEGVYGLNIWGELDAGTDLTVYRADYNKSKALPSLNNYNNTDPYLQLTWQHLYEGINRANDYIASITGRTDSDCGGARKKTMFLAEAKALRALFYMNLVAYWGEVPLRLEVVRDLAQQQLKKSSQPEIYRQIIKDLEEAEPGCLPADELNAPGRIAKTTVQALLARAYMWQAGYPVEADTWEDALIWARKVRDSGLHTLYKMTEDGVNGYRALFINMCSNKYDLTYRESMFEVEFYGNGLDKTNESGKVGLYMGISQQTTTDPDVPRAYAWYHGTKLFFKMFEDADARKWWNFADYKYVTTDGKVKKVMLSDSDKASYVDGDPGKWRAEYDPVRPWSLNSSSINFPVMRYSDVLLMIAECANEVAGSPTKEAVDAINEVRKRAGISEIGLTDCTQSSFRDSIKVERTRELCFEVPRHMELRRWGKQYFFDRINLLKDQSMDSQNKKIGYDLTTVKALPAINLAEKHIYYPIPQAELNTNPTCGQNVNW